MLVIRNHLLQRLVLPMLVIGLTACSGVVPATGSHTVQPLTPWRVLQAAPDNHGRFLQLARPVAVAGWQDVIFIADAGRNTIYRYDRIADRLQAFASLTLAPGVRMTAHPAGGLYVTDPARGQVLRLDDEGHVVTEFRDFNLHQPVALADDPRGGRLLVLDGPWRQILAFNRLGRLEEVIQPRAEPGPPPGNLVDLAADAEDFYLLDDARHEVLVTDRRGRIVRRFGHAQLKQPAALVRGPFGRILVADPFDGRLWIFPRSGSEGEPVSVAANAARITDLGISEQWLFAADDGMGAVHIFRIEPPPGEPGP